MAKELCTCGEIAVWIYMPGFSSGSSPYFCDKCVHRGCSCNYRYVDQSDIDNNPPHDFTPISNLGLPNLDLPTGPHKWIEEFRIWVSLDDDGREFPCCEYEYEEAGFDIEILL